VVPETDGRSPWPIALLSGSKISLGLVTFWLRIPLCKILIRLRQGFLLRTRLRRDKKTETLKSEIKRQTRENRRRNTSSSRIRTALLNQDFARTPQLFLEASLMTRGTLCVVAGFLSLCFPLSAQQTQTQRLDVFSALNRSVLRLPSLTLSDGQRFFFSSAFSWIEPTEPDFLPALGTPRPQRANGASSATTPKDSSKEVVDVRRSNLFDYASGEVGFLYGRSTGKHGVEVEQGYIIGEVGDDKFHITVGAAYENSSGRVPHFGH
jgi:hypothetical protein